MVRKVNYREVRDIETAQAIYDEAREDFKRVRSKYSGPISIFRKKIDEADNKKLSDCIGALLPLGSSRPVQDQVMSARNIEGTLHYNITGLMMNIMNYLTRFQNSGVTAIPATRGTIF